ncbi:hypothetical protein GGR57DRAFT_500634 [Xylariaceae sp. FL1272]|nr:hypothetical protein GGR57DRAFT_500634 [Xylariaceae sp. FL1272]
MLIRPSTELYAAKSSHLERQWVVMNNGKIPHFTHAHALYQATFSRPSPYSLNKELAVALDAFQEAFETRFPLDHRPFLPRYPTQLQLKQAENERYDRRKLHERYSASQSPPNTATKITI